jgi:hypothetical protein
MKTLCTLITAVLVLASVPAFAHGGNEHVRGVVTQVSAQSVIVQTAPNVTKTLTLSDKTTFKKGSKSARLADLKVGDRVVIDVPEKTNQALLIQIGAAATETAHK